MKPLRAERPITRIDLHVHSRYSDGLSSPVELVERAKALGLQGLAITDHNNIDAQLPAWLAARRVEIGYLMGVELHTLFKQSDGNFKRIHILGYGFDFYEAKENKAFGNYLRHINAVAEKYIKGLCAASLEHPFVVTSPDGIKHLIGIEFYDTRRFRHGHTMSSTFDWPLLFKLKSLIPGIVITKGDIYNAFISQDPAKIASLESGNPGLKIQANPAFKEGKARIEPELKRSYMKPEEAIKLLLKIGAVPVIAHPGVKRGGVNDKELSSLIGMGIRGIEVWSAKHSKQQIIKYKKIAEKNSLLRTGGTDFHAEEANPGVVLGMLDEFTPVQSDPIEAILEKRL